MIKRIRLSSGQKIYAHSEAVCSGNACCIHNPSDHHMREWKQWWRDDIGLMERMCPHGIGHPDPDHMTFVLSSRPLDGSPMGLHGCDGCCQPVFIVDGEVVSECVTDSPKLLPP